MVRIYCFYTRNMNKMQNKLLQRKQHLDQQESNKKVFLTDLGAIITALHTYNKKDADICKIKELYLIAKRETPDIIIQRGGPYIWKYRKEIWAREEKFFLNNDFKDEIANASQTGVAEMTEFAEFPAIITKLKRTWHLLTPEERTVMWAKLTSVLAQYAGYLQAEKELEKLK